MEIKNAVFRKLKICHHLQKVTFLKKKTKISLTNRCLATFKQFKKLKKSQKSFMVRSVIIVLFNLDPLKNVVTRPIPQDTNEASTVSQ